MVPQVCCPYQTHSVLLSGACWGCVSSSKHLCCMELHHCFHYTSGNTVATKHVSYEEVLTVCDNRSRAASFWVRCCPAADSVVWRRSVAAAGAEAAVEHGARRGSGGRGPGIDPILACPWQKTRLRAELAGCWGSRQHAAALAVGWSSSTQRRVLYEPFRPLNGVSSRGLTASDCERLAVTHMF